MGGTVVPVATLVANTNFVGQPGRTLKIQDSEGAGVESAQVFAFRAELGIAESCVLDIPSMTATSPGPVFDGDGNDLYGDPLPPPSVDPYILVELETPGLMTDLLITSEEGGAPQSPELYVDELHPIAVCSARKHSTVKFTDGGGGGSKFKCTVVYKSSL